MVVYSFAFNLRKKNITKFSCLSTSPFSCLSLAPRWSVYTKHRFVWWKFPTEGKSATERNKRSCETIKSWRFPHSTKSTISFLAAIIESVWTNGNIPRRSCMLNCCGPTRRTIMFRALTIWCSMHNGYGSLGATSIASANGTYALFRYQFTTIFNL